MFVTQSADRKGNCDARCPSRGCEKASERLIFGFPPACARAREKTHMKQRIFLSYASPDSDWVESFCDQRWFGHLLIDVKIENYQNIVNFGSIRTWIDEEINSAA